MSFFLLLLSTLSACSQPRKMEATPDRFERLNRSVYKVNATLDRRLFKPVAIVYNKFTPQIIDTSITNVFANLDDVGNAINNLLQFKVGEALIDTERFIFNSTFGIAGIFDIATEMGLQKHEEDFGQTLAKWGVPSGPYVMLPLLGPSTIRDATAKLSVDILTKPTSYSEYSWPLLVVDKLDQRADLLSAEEVLKVFSDDQYSVLRGVWLQRREHLIQDGKVDEKAQSDMVDELEDLDAE